MAFLELGIAKQIIQNAPKYRRIIEPFGAFGTIALYLGKKKPKEHILNLEDEILFALVSFIQGHTSADKKVLKNFDWVASPETFDAAMAITATEGAELFYKFFYTKKFGAKNTDPEMPMDYDHLKTDHDMKSILYQLPLQKVGLKGVTLMNADSLSIVSTSSGSDTFVILLPKTPEQIDAVEKKLPLSSPFFYAKKSPGNEDLFQSVADSGEQTKVSYISASSIMMATLEIRTNYENKLDEIVLPDN